MAQRLPDGFGVVVTRPAEQAGALCALVESAGGKALRLPLLEIVPLAPDSEGFRRLASLHGVDWLVFVSANAVRYASDALVPGGRARPKIAAVGQATADELVRRGIAVDLTPKQQFNSESLLALPEMTNVAGQRILIVRGEGGRELLAQTLLQRSAEVSYAEIYRRVEPPVDVEGLLARWRAGEVGAVTVTSGDALEHLFRLMAGAGLELLKHTPLVVIGERLKQRAANLGCMRIAAAEASDRGVFEAVVRIAREVIKTNQPRG